MIDAMNERQKEFHRENENTIYVTEITTCLEKRKGINNEYVLMRGTIIHEGIQWLLQTYGRGHTIEVEKKVQKEVDIFSIEGRVDVVLDGIPIELKTVNRIPSEPDEEHLYQLLIYMNFLGKTKGLLVYLSMTDMREFEIELIEKNRIRVNDKEREIQEVNDEFLFRLAKRVKEGKNYMPFNECNKCWMARECPMYITP